MIDTVKFQIKKTQKMVDLISKKSVEIRKYNHNTETEIFKIYNEEVNLGSYDSHINIFLLSDKDTFSIEFSAPKFYYGHNVYLLYFDEYLQTLENVWSCLSDYFGDFPKTSQWVYQRIDVCYAWKLPSEYYAKSLLSILRTFSIPRKHVIEKDTSIMWVGSDSSSKFYMKQPEYWKNDFKRLKKIDHEFAYKIHDISAGVIRFESTIRKKALDYYLGPDLNITGVQKSDIIYLLNMFFKKVMNGVSPTFMTPDQVFQQLSKFYKKDKAVNLWTFYQIYYSDDTNHRRVINNLSRYTIKRRLNSLEKAGIGLPIKDFQLDLDFTIPSNYVINEETLEETAPAVSDSPVV